MFDGGTTAGSLWHKGRPIVFVLLLCGFPLLSVDFALRSVLKIHESNLVQDTVRRLEAKVIRLKPWGEPEVYFNSLFRRRLAGVGRSHDPVSKARKALEMLARQHPKLFSFILFDGKGRVAWVSPDFHPSRQVAERLLSGIMAGLGGDMTPLESRWKVFAHFLGTRFTRPDVLFNGPHFLRTANLPSRTWFKFVLDRRYAVFANIHRRGYTPYQGLRAMVNRPQRDGISLSLVNANAGEYLGFGTREFLAGLGRAVRRFEERPHSFLQAEGRLWSILMLDPAYRLVASVPDPSGVLPALVQRAFRWSGAAFLLLMLWISSAIGAGERLPYLSLRWKLMALFLLSAGVPLAILGFLGNIYLHEQGTALTLDTWRDMTESLRDLDQNSGVIHQRIQSEAQNILDAHDPGDPNQRPTLQRKLEAFSARFGCKDFRVIDTAGKHLLTSWGTFVTSSTAKFFLTTTMEAMAYLNREASQGALAEAVNPNSMLVTIFGEKWDATVDAFVGDLGRITRSNVGTTSGFFYNQVFKNAAGMVTHSFVATWRVDTFEGRCLKLLLADRREDRKGARFFAIRKLPSWEIPTRFSSRELGISPTHRKIFWAVGRPPKGRQFRNFFQAIRRTDRPAVGRIEDLDHSMLIAGIPGNELGAYHLFCTRPLADIASQIGDLRRQLLGFGLMSAVFTIGLAFLLASKVLVPVRNLGAGLEAIRQKKFRHRIPEADPDELGDLVGLFNSMMGSLEEMSVGKQVQENLFPQAPLRCGGIGVFGLSRSATDLGGDYFDYLKVAGDRVLVLVGDVTGHGIPAALVMALSKAVVATLAPTDPDPERIMTALNRVIAENTRRKLFMSLCLLWIDAATLDIEVLNAGHPYPLLQTPDGRFQDVRAQGVLLGMRRNPLFKKANLRLGPGDRLLLYTDGLFECLAPKGGDGYLLWEEYLQSRPRLPFDETPQDVLAHHPETLTALPQADDHTFLVVEALADPAPTRPST